MTEYTKYTCFPLFVLFKFFNFYLNFTAQLQFILVSVPCDFEENVYLAVGTWNTV